MLLIVRPKPCSYVAVDLLDTVTHLKSSATHYTHTADYVHASMTHGDLSYNKLNWETSQQPNFYDRVPTKISRVKKLMFCQLAHVLLDS